MYEPIGSLADVATNKERGTVRSVCNSGDMIE
jgi:hypothetical protein